MKAISCMNALVLVAVLGAVVNAPPASADQETAAASKPATAATSNANATVHKRLPFSDQQDYKDAQRGFIATLPQLDIQGQDGRTVWTLKGYEFLQAKQAPATVNPSLWRIAQLNMSNGLYKVVDGIYQIRGFDLSNMTILETDNGIVVVDPLVSEEVARAGLELYYAHRPKKPVKAVIYTHSHADHYGGVKGVVTEADVKSGAVAVLAPEGFLEEAVSENVLAGNAMSRRALYMYGALLPRGPQGQVDGGLGKTNSIGTVGLIAPTDEIKETGDKRVIDGLELHFQMAPGTEAPAEMLFYIPKYKALCTAEDATHTLHNLYTIRGAQVRDANKWWKAINKTLSLWGGEAEVAYASHHWPTWGNAKVVDFLEKQRDLYKYIHDQSLQMVNQGYTISEIGERLELPPTLANAWFNRDYYGTVNHDAKAVYQRYMGWYSANPADLFPLPPEEAAKRYVEFMGGADAVIQRARASYDKGDYRWVAEVMKQVVFADPTNKPARDLQADALEQLGYQSEAGTWRSAFLMGAYELRNGVPKIPGAQSASPDTIRAMTVPMVLDFMAMRLDAQKARGKSYALNLTVPDLSESYRLEVKNSVLVYQEGPGNGKEAASLSLPKSSLDAVLLGQSTVAKEIESGRATVTGDASRIEDLLGMLVKFDPLFNIVTP